MTNTYPENASNDAKLVEEIRCLRSVMERILRVMDEGLFVDYQMEKFGKDRIHTPINPPNNEPGYAPGYPTTIPPHSHPNRNKHLRVVLLAEGATRKISWIVCWGFAVPVVSARPQQGCVLNDRH